MHIVLFMSGYGKSRLSFVFCVLFLFGSTNLSAQLKANDFTKRVGIFDGKMSSLSGRASKFNRVSSSSYRRISVEEWPAHFSPFGGKRFPMGSAKIWGGERVPSSRMEIKTPLNDQIANETSQRATNQNLSKHDPAANAVEFRDAYYARLNDRVDEWMEKVNNMSLQDINRYQFRRGRSKEPGFPVQRAGAAGMKDARRESTVRSSGLPSAPEASAVGNNQYWMGPRKINNTSSSIGLGQDTKLQRQAPSLRTNLSKQNFKASTKPILGPKTIRVEVGGSE